MLFKVTQVKDRIRIQTEVTLTVTLKKQTGQVLEDLSVFSLASSGQCT